MPLAGSPLAQTRYQTRARKGLPTAILALPTSSAMPSGVSTRAKPAPVAGSRRDSTVCGPSAGRVGQISASTMSAFGRTQSSAATTAYEPGQACWMRDG
jgi:hypothetical protein